MHPSSEPGAYPNQIAVSAAPGPHHFVPRALLTSWLLPLTSSSTNSNTAGGAPSHVRSQSRWQNSNSHSIPRRRLASSSPRSEEHTSELQSRGHLVCRLLLEKKK